MHQTSNQKHIMVMYFWSTYYIISYVLLCFNLGFQDNMACSSVYSQEHHAKQKGRGEFSKFRSVVRNAQLERQQVICSTSALSHHSLLFSRLTHIILYHMWQSRVENEHYSVAYFDPTRAFTTLYLRTSVMGGAHTCRVEASHIDATT